MGIINTYKEQAKEGLSPKMKYRGAIDEAKELAQKSAEKEGPSVSDSVDMNEFVNRYKSVQMYLSMNIGVIGFAIYQTLTVNDFLAVASCLFLLAMASIFYYKTAFKAWMAREVFKKWDRRSENFKFYFSDFNDAIAEDWKNILPIKLETKDGDRDEKQ